MMSRHSFVTFLIVLFLFTVSSGITQSIDTPPTETTDGLIVLSDEVVAHIRAIYAVGQIYGNRDYVFSKIGDSLTVSHRFLDPFGTGEYNTGVYDYLKPLIHNYTISHARTGNPFINRSLSAGEGWSANAVLNSDYANEYLCLPDESPLFCEYRLVRPSIALIMLGTNDTGYRQEGEFRADMESIILFTQGSGIIPVLSTIPERPDKTEQVAVFNIVIRELAENHHIPLIELYTNTVELPNYGLTSDNVHLSTPPDGYSTIFDPVHLQYGYTVRNYLTLEMLYAIHRVIDA